VVTDNAAQRDPAADRATVTRTGAHMTRGTSEIDQYRHRTTGEVSLEDSREAPSCRLRAHFTGPRLRSPSAPSEIAQKLNAGERRCTISDLNNWPSGICRLNRL
jgi:hypothetical protein